LTLVSDYIVVTLLNNSMCFFVWANVNCQFVAI